MSEIQKKFSDVLQNIESSIVEVFRHNPTLTNYDVDEALKLAIDRFKREIKGHQPAQIKTTERSLLVFQAVVAVCEYRLGRSEPLEVAPIGPADLLDCLRTIQKSVQFWTKEGGRQGYLTFVSQFV